MGYSSKFAHGISRSIRVAAYPPVYITDIWAKTSVSQRQLAVEVEVFNRQPRAVTLEIALSLSPWKPQVDASGHTAGERTPPTAAAHGGSGVGHTAEGAYPPLPTMTAVVPARGNTTVRWAPVQWALGTSSWWWPNKPFREDYVASLHVLNVALKPSSGTDKVKGSDTDTGAATGRHGIDTYGAASTSLASANSFLRFGFVEWGEGQDAGSSTNNTYYTVNGPSQLCAAAAAGCTPSDIGNMYVCSRKQ